MENFFMNTKLLEKQNEKFYTAKYDRAFKEIFLNEKNEELLLAVEENIYTYYWKRIKHLLELK